MNGRGRATSIFSTCTQTRSMTSAANITSPHCRVSLRASKTIAMISQMNPFSPNIVTKGMRASMNGDTHAAWMPCSMAMSIGLPPLRLSAARIAPHDSDS